MALHLKPFVGSATVSDHKVFIWARLKLTGIYVLILGVILLIFSALLYQSLSRNLGDASDENFSGVESHHHFVKDTLSSVKNEILTIDIIILMGAAGVSYVLAGFSLKPIQRSLENQRQFSESASHELRTPLAVMKNDIEVLLRNPSPTRQLTEETLRSNIEEINRMTKMTEDLLLIARSENYSTVTMEKVDIATVVRQTAERLQVVAAKKFVTLSVASATGLLIHGDKMGLERVVTNLLQNAIEHTPEKGSITIAVNHLHHKARITITDTGSGIDKKHLPHIFNRFYKGERAAGSGLGLSIVKELVNQHKGEIDVKSTRGVGTVITLDFPALS